MTTPPTYIFFGGPILSADDSSGLAQLNPVGEALRTKDGQIDGVGLTADLRRETPDAETIDLRGSSLFAGFTDTHTHLFEFGRRQSGVDLMGCASMAEVESRLRDYRGMLKPGQRWIGGGGFDRERYPDAERLHRSLLDEIFPDHAVGLEARDLHTMWCNTRALQEAGVFSGAKSSDGGHIGRDAHGRPDGLLYESAWELITTVRPVESIEVRQTWARRAAREANALGLTGVHSMEKTFAQEAYAALEDSGDLPLRIHFHSPLADLDARIAAGHRSYPRRWDRLRLAGVKIFMDGSLGSRSAYMLEPYPDGGRGCLVMEPDQLRGAINRAAAAGIAPTVHAIGDACVRLVIDAVEAVRRSMSESDTDFDGFFPRIEHAQCVRPPDVPRLAEAGIYCAMQPIHLADDIPLMPKLWPQAGAFAYPTRSMVDAGVRIGLGSDSPVANLDPRAGIFAACARAVAPGGDAWHAEEALTAPEAVAGYTLWAARGGRAESQLGTLEVGKRADLSAYQVEDPARAEAWLQAIPRLTMVAGKIVYEDLA